MISSMRAYFKGLKFVLLLVIVAFIATSVVYFGASSVSDPAAANAVATVNGEAVPIERYQRALASYMDFYQRIYRERLTSDFVERLGIPDQVVAELVQEALIVQQAAREGIRVTDDDLRASILAIRAFQEDGRFSRERYRAVLRRARLDEGTFETEQRRELVRRRMETLVKQGVKVSEEELREAYAVRRETVRAAWASLPLDRLGGEVAVADAEIEPYLKAHEARFARPERRQVQYVLVSGARFAAPVSDADAEAYFKEHPAEFEKPRRVRGAHVLVRVPPVGGSEAEQGARAKAADVIKRAAAGADFAKLARERSEDAATAAQGGDLGFVRAGELVPEFERALFALTPGQVAPEPVRTPFGYHAIKAIAVEEGGRPPYREVAPRIKEKLLAERSDRAARDKADELRGALQGAADFAAESRRLGFEARAATLARGDSLEGIGHDVQLEEATFSLAVGGVGAPVKTAAGYAIVRIVERLAAGVPPLDEIKGAVRDAARRDKAEALALERATALVGALGQGGEFAALARGRGFTVGETPLYSRETPPKDSPLPGDVLAAALRTPTGQVAEPVKTPTGVFVVKTLERRAPDPAGFDAARAELEAQILGQKRNLVWERWLATLRAEAKVDLQPRLGLR